jgi:hypothetical protein
MGLWLPYAVDVVVGPRELARDKATRLMLHEFLESILVELLILHVVVLVFL